MDKTTKYIESIKKIISDSDKELNHLNDEKKMLDESYDKKSEGYIKQSSVIESHKNDEEKRKNLAQSVLDSYDEVKNILKNMDILYPFIRKETDPEKKDKLNKDLDLNYKRFKELKVLFPKEIQTELENEIVTISERIPVTPVLPKDDKGVSNVVRELKDNFTMQDIKDDLESDKNEIKRIKAAKKDLKKVKPTDRDYEKALVEIDKADKRLIELNQNEQIYFGIIDLYEQLKVLNKKKTDIDKYRDVSIKNATIKEANNIVSLIDDILAKMPKDIKDILDKKLDDAGYSKFVGLYAKDETQRDKADVKLENLEMKKEAYDNQFKSVTEGLLDPNSTNYEQNLNELNKIQRENNPYSKKVDESKRTLESYDKISERLDYIEKAYMGLITSSSAIRLLDEIHRREEDIRLLMVDMPEKMQDEIVRRKEHILANYKTIREVHENIRKLFEDNIEALYKNEEVYKKARPEDKNYIMSKLLYARKNAFISGISKLNNYVKDKQNIPGVTKTILNIDEINKGVVNNNSAYSVYLGVSSLYKDGKLVKRPNIGYEPMLKKLDMVDAISRIKFDGVKMPDNQKVTYKDIEKATDKLTEESHENKVVKAKKTGKKANVWTYVNMAFKSVTSKFSKVKDKPIDEVMLQNEEFDEDEDITKKLDKLEPNSPDFEKALNDELERLAKTNFKVKKNHLKKIRYQFKRAKSKFLDSSAYKKAVEKLDKLKSKEKEQEKEKGL